MSFLTICIPTYNRVDLLKIAINSIINSINYSNFEVDIIISDNCSTDNTKEFCLNLINEYPFIQYFRNEKNVIELNFYLAIERAKTKYVWLFGDDDLMNLNSIYLVHTALNLGNNLVIVNYDLYDNSLEKILRRNYFSLKFDKVYNNKNELLLDFNLKLGFISCVIFDRNQFLTMNIDLFDSYRPYGFPFVFGLYSSLNDNLRALVISDSVIKQRGFDSPADINWWYKCFVEGSSKILNELNKLSYKNSSIIKAKKSIFNQYVISDLVRRKTNDHSTRQAIPYLFKYYMKYPIQLVISMIIIFTPNYIIKKIYSLKIKLNNECNL